MDDIERLIRERKHKIMSETSGNQQKRRTVWRAAKKRNLSVESNFSKRLTGRELVFLFMHIKSKKSYNIKGTHTACFSISFLQYE